MILKVYLPGRMKLCLRKKEVASLVGHQEVHYIGGTEVLPPPLEGMEEMEVINGLDTDEVDLITANIINERNPVCYGADTRWANHLYPVYVTECYAKSKYLSSAMFLNLF